jgi:hypothetical protein
MANNRNGNLNSTKTSSQVTRLDQGLLLLEARCMEGYRDYWMKIVVGSAKPLQYLGCNYYGAGNN